jgi:hypothetical protein
VIDAAPGSRSPPRSSNPGVMFLRGCLVVAVSVALLTGCASHATRRASSSRSIDIGASAAMRIAEDLALRDTKGDPVLSRPSAARLMTFEQAERAIGSGVDYSLGGSAAVWLVHVYANFGSPHGSPPRPPWAPTTTTPQTTPTPQPSYFVIIDAATGRVVVENY